MAEPLLPKEPIPQRVARLLAWVAGAAVLFGCAIPITAEVIGRRLFGLTFHSFEISGYAFAACVGLGAAFTVTQKSNIRVDILQGYLPAPLRLLCDVLAAVALATCACALAWYGWITVATSARMGARSESVLQVPMTIPQGIWWFGLLVFAILSVIVLLQALAALALRRAGEADALIGSLRVHEEMSQSGVATATKDQRP
jgi:TRAP-type C4-dicarboxylate transport system permease small subunit